MPASPLCLLLLPRALEEYPEADQARDLLRAPNVIAIEPARMSYGAFARLPETLADALASTQSRRLTRQLPGEPRVVVVFEPLQYRLARAIVGRHEGCELWYGAADAGSEPVLHDLAVARAALRFSWPGPAGEAAFRSNALLWDRLEQLGIARR